MLLAIVVAMAVVRPGPVSAQGPVDGTYTMSVTVTWACEHHPDDTEEWVILDAGFVIPLGEVKVVQSGSNVSFTIAGDAYTGSIDADLNFDLTIDTDNLIGHFTLLSDGGATISGETVSVCSGVTRPNGRLTGSRTSGGPAPTPTDSAIEAPEDQLGSRLAIDTIYGDLCAGEEGDVERANCGFAAGYGNEFRAAMEADKFALPAGISGEAAAALDRLIATVQLAANAAPLQGPGPCGVPVPALPITKALLPVFAKYFTQGIRQVANHQFAELQATASLADTLLLLAITADKASATRSSCSVGEG